MTAAGKSPLRSPSAAEGAAERQRLDKWLWFARIVKSRSLAAKLVSEGHVRVNSARSDNPAKPVRIGDVLTVALDRQVRVLKVLAPGIRRGPFPEAQTLFEDMSGAGEASGPAPDASFKAND